MKMKKTNIKEMEISKDDIKLLQIEIPKILKVSKVMQSKSSRKLYCQAECEVDGRNLTLQLTSEQVRQINPQLLLDYYEQNICSTKTK